MAQSNQFTLPEVVVVEQRPRRYLRVRDAMRDLGCSRSHIANLLKAGKVQSCTLDGLVLIRSDDWDAYLDTAVDVEGSK